MRTTMLNMWHDNEIIILFEKGLHACLTEEYLEKKFKILVNGIYSTTLSSLFYITL